MNVAVVEQSEGIGEEAPAVPASEWIDPEGDDWILAIYRDLMAETVGVSLPETEHWFG